ncbi:MAG: hypothetical protein CMK09_06985 [Ponticaulis sp.]|nr:hypothetical protein [Ponticaulis sp.]|tara:strand:+ start:61723 stop:62655 length:933 start_codon:yes stop_codon:yes gene_type:complete
MSKNWLSDFQFEDGAFLVKKTGHTVPMNLGLFGDILVWMSFFTLAQGWRLWHWARGHRAPRIAFLPDQPRPWYFIWPVLHAAGAKIEKDLHKADVIFQFDDSTHCNAKRPQVTQSVKYINFNCLDVSKSLVAKAFEKVSGYSLAVDPTTYTGMMVEKSEINAAHDGRTLQGPAARLEGKSYQRLVDNQIPGDLVEDLRTTVVAGEPTIVFRKRRPVHRRFANENCDVRLMLPGDCFSTDELAIIRSFVSEIGLDWGGVDVLRDAGTGKIYIVDANKTDMGPPVALPLGQKLRATRLMARKFAASYAPKVR